MSAIKVEPPEERKLGDTDMEESKRKYLTTENQRIRKALLKFSKRQEVLEEFIALEHDQESVQRFEENRRRMTYALSITDEEMAQGKDNPKIRGMLKLLRIAINYWKGEKSQINRPSNRDARLRYESRVPPELAAERLHVDFDTGLIGRKPIKRCHKCYDTSHVEKLCPFKKAESRTPEVKAMIQDRFERVKEDEGKDPLISKKYKKKHFKIDERRDRLRKEREMKKMTRIGQGGGEGGNKPSKKKVKMMDGTPAAAGNEEDDEDESDNEDDSGEDADMN